MARSKHCLPIAHPPVAPHGRLPDPRQAQPRNPAPPGQPHHKDPRCLISPATAPHHRRVGRRRHRAHRALCTAWGHGHRLRPARHRPDRPHIATAHQFDLRDRPAIAAAATAILTDPPQIVVSNAGWTRQDTLAATTPDGIEDELARNLTGAMHLTQTLLPALRSGTGNRAVIFVSSVNALTHHGNPAYSAAKAGMLAYMRAIAVEEGPPRPARQCRRPGLHPHQCLGIPPQGRSWRDGPSSPPLPPRPPRHARTRSPRPCLSRLAARLGHHGSGARRRCRAHGRQPAFLDVIR